MSPAIIYYDYEFLEFDSLKSAGHFRTGKNRSFEKVSVFNEVRDLENWVREWEESKAKEILETDITHRDDVNVWITNIVRV